MTNESRYYLGGPGPVVREGAAATGERLGGAGERVRLGGAGKRVLLRACALRRRDGRTGPGGGDGHGDGDGDG